MDFTNLFNSPMQTNINDNNTLLNNGNENVGTVDSSNSNENSNINSFMVSSSSLSPQTKDDNDITKFLMEAEAFLLNENPPLASTSTLMTDVTEMPMFEFQQFNTNLTPSTPPQQIKDQSEQQSSITQQQQQQQQQMISFFQSDDTHITMVNPNPSPASAARKVTKSTQRRQANRMKEPIFVTEVPQNAYKKKKKSRSQSSDEEDSDEGAMELKKLSSKQRRQLRNKISARNFRVRRKEYIEQLESQVEEQDKEIEQLKLVNTKLEKTNQELFQELQYWRTMVPTPPATTSVSSDNNSTSSPPETIITTTFPPLDLDQFSLFDFNGDTHLAHAAIPDFDFSQILTDKLLCDGGEEGEVLPEDHERDQDGNIVLKPKELIKAYPLFVPALMSMIVRHTFSLHYIAYYTSTLDVSFSDNKTLDLLGQHEWMQQAFNSGNNNSGAITASGNRRRNSCNSQDEKDHMKESNIPLSCEEEGEQVEDDERAEVEAFMRDNYLHYAFWRMCGLSHEQVYRKFIVCYHTYGCRNARKAEEKKEKKWSKANLQRQISTMSAYVTVSNTVLHHPERLPLIASVLKRNSFTKISAQQQKSFLGLPGSSTPSIAGPSSSRKKAIIPSLKTIKIGGRRD
ncbi:hypothetical protein BDC45DRAFT_536304 [Circinella umbellata]|nr:hypothetical protein BDC45DRAFT_536304 [Circinella umbellata]